MIETFLIRWRQSYKINMFLDNFKVNFYMIYR